MNRNSKRIAVLAADDGWHFQDLARAAANLGELELTSIPFPSVTAAIDPPGSTVDIDADLVFARAMPAGSLEQIVFRMDALMVLVENGTPVVNPPKAIEASVDKYLALARMKQAGIEVPDTRVSQTLESAVQYFNELDQDVVVKPIFGSLGNGLVRLENLDQARAHFARCIEEQKVIYQQRYIDHGGSDCRVMMIGDRHLAMARNRPGHWITNMAQGAQGRPIQLSPELINLAAAATRAVGAQVAGVDLVYDRLQDRWLVLEVNSAPGWKYMASVCKVDVAELILRYLVDKIA